MNPKPHLRAVVNGETAEEALRYLADPESWHGNPHDQSAWLFGHFTPYELAARHLAYPRTPKGRRRPLSVAKAHLRAVVEGETGELHATR